MPFKKGHAPLPGGGRPKGTKDPHTREREAQKALHAQQVYAAQERITAAQIAYVQQLIDTIYSDFVGAVSASRGMRAETVRKMEAKVFVGQQAVDNKLIDGIMSFDKAMSQLGKLVKSSTASRKAKALMQLHEMQD